MKKDDNAVWITIDTSAAILKYIISKGSITIDGVSLTVAKVDNKSFAVSVIPHTGQNTTLLDKKPGDTVNLENDMLRSFFSMEVYRMRKKRARQRKRALQWIFSDKMDSN